MVASLPVNNKIVRWLDDDERARLLDACERSEWPKMKLLVLLALGTGARKSELLNLRWIDIDFGRKVARLADTKSGDFLPTKYFDRGCRHPRVIHSPPHSLPPSIEDAGTENSIM